MDVPPFKVIHTDDDDDYDDSATSSVTVTHSSSASVSVLGENDTSVSTFASSSQRSSSIVSPSSTTTWASSNDEERVNPYLTYLKTRTFSMADLDDNWNCIVPHSTIYTSSPENECKDDVSTRGPRVIDLVLEPQPHASFPRRTFAVFNFLASFARWTGLMSPVRPTKKRVRFPEDVIKKSEEQGETSPDMANVKLSTPLPYRASYSKKKSQVIRVLKTMEFKPRVAWIENMTKCETKMENCIANCSCADEYQEPTKVLLKKEERRRSSKGRKKEDPFKMSKLTESFMNHVNVADLFLIAHKVQTLSPALRYVDGSMTRRRRSGWTESVMSIMIGQRPSALVKVEAVVPGEELPPLSKTLMGKLAINVWLFGHCIPHLFTAVPPTQPAFIRLMGSLATMAMAANDASLGLIPQSKEFYNYATETMRIIKNLQLKVMLEGETDIKGPIKMGQGLKLLNKLNSALLPKIEVAKFEEEDEEDLVFLPFDEMDSSEKIDALDALITETRVDFDRAVNQIYFLVEDVKEVTFDAKNDSDVLYRLSEMYHCIMQISAVSENSDKGRQELQAICEAMSFFIVSLHSFVLATQHVMEKIMEVRDMVQLVYVFLQKQEKFDISKLVPADHPVRFATRMGIKVSKGCCKKGKTKTIGESKIKIKVHGNRSKSRRARWVKYRMPNYSGSDFWKTHFEEAYKVGDIKCQGIASGYAFRLKPDRGGTVKAASAKKIDIRFRKSENENRGSTDSNRSDDFDKVAGAFSMGHQAAEVPLTSSVSNPTLKPIIKMRSEEDADSAVVEITESHADTHSGNKGHATEKDIQATGSSTASSEASSSHEIQEK